jgi:hypothetical protein
MRNKLLCFALTDAVMLLARFASAATVDFTGTTFNGCGATVVHGTNGGGTFWPLAANAPIDCVWNETTGLQGATAVFGTSGNARMSLSTNDVGIARLDMIPNIGTAGTANNTLTVGERTRGLLARLRWAVCSFPISSGAIWITNLQQPVVTFWARALSSLRLL